ncbi:MAG: protein translocase subunit SecD [Bdellovibrionales bacterium]
MIKSIKARIIIVLGVLIAAAITMYPNFADKDKLENSDWMFSKSALKFGLDLQGGLHLVMGVDMDSVIEISSQRLTGTLKEFLTEEGVSVNSVKLVPQEGTYPQFSVELASSGDIEKAEEALDSDYGQTLQVLDTQGAVMSLRYLDLFVKDLKKRTLEQAIETIRNRIDEFGVSEPSITAQGDERVLVQLPGAKISEIENAKALINKAAYLEFQLVEAQTPEELPLWIEEAEKAGGYKLGENELKYSQYVDRLNKDIREKLPENTEIIFGKAENVQSLTVAKVPYLVRKDTNLDGDSLKSAKVDYDEFGNPVVSLNFNPVGAKKFADITGDNVGRLLAIVLDQVVYSAPNLQERIGGGRAQITLGRGRDPQATLNEAKILSMALRAGALPARLEQLEERTVGPTLGADSIEAGKKAVTLGFVLVLVFMLFYYKGFGVIANIALLVNIFLVLALLTALGATLTLPGIAGIALTVGMAVDANVIIFERIKEELARGQNYKKAMEDGFGHAFSAIFDANITTGVVCIILMYFGTGPVRGFAVTLLCGLVTSMFTAIFLSRTIFEYCFNKLGIKKIAV